MVFQRFVSRIVVPNGRLLALKPAQFRTDTPVAQSGSPEVSLGVGVDPTAPAR